MGGFAAGNGTNAKGPYGIANYYYVPNDSTKATSVTFAINNPSDLTNETIDLILYQVDLDGDDNLDDNGDGFFNSIDIINNTVAFSQYTFTGNESPNQLITVPLENFNTSGSNIPLNKESSYLITLEYSGQNLMLFTVGKSIPYSNLNTIGIDTDTDTWFLGGFPNGILAVLRLNIQDILTTTERILPQNSLTVFPNPTSNFIQLAVDLQEVSKNVTIRLTNLMGQTIFDEQHQHLQRTTLSYDTHDLAQGVYFLTILTEKGQLTKKIVIQH